MYVTAAPRQERMKAAALGQEMEKPMNVHRWRHLEGADPAAHELLLQTQALQRRLIAQTEVRHCPHGVRSTMMQRLVMRCRLCRAPA